jgi:hypothetical protein
MTDTKYEIVKGCDKLGYYDVKMIKDVEVRFFQISQFEVKGMISIRSYLFKGTGTSPGGCFYEYSIKEVIDYKLNKKQLKQFEKVLKNKKDNSNYKIMFKYYPVYELSFTPPPSGQELSQCTSELLK